MKLLEQAKAEVAALETRIRQCEQQQQQFQQEINALQSARAAKLDAIAEFEAARSES